MKRLKKKWAYRIGLCLAIGALFWVLSYIWAEEDRIVKLERETAHKAEVFKHESDCYELQVCLESSLSFDNNNDICYPVNHVFGWPGEKSDSFINTCQLFKKIRNANGQSVIY